MNYAPTIKLRRTLVMKNMMNAVAAIALLLGSSLAARGDEAKGTISAIETAAGTVTLSDGKVFILPQHLAKATVLRVGDRVTVTYTPEQAGKMTAIDVFVDAGAPSR
jgi:hypothetical protein